MTMTPHLRKFALIAHIISSVGLLGAIAGFLALAVAGWPARMHRWCAPPIAASRGVEGRGSTTS